MSFPTEQEHFDAVKAALAVGNARPHSWGETTTERNYTLVATSPRAGGMVRSGGVIGVRLVRIDLLFVGADPDSVNEMRQRGRTALEEKQLDVAGHSTSPIRLETADAVGPDGDPDDDGQKWFSAAMSMTYGV